MLDEKLKNEKIQSPEAYNFTFENKAKNEQKLKHLKFDLKTQF